MILKMKFNPSNEIRINSIMKVGSDGIYLVGKLENKMIRMLVYSGASVTVLRSSVAKNVGKFKLTPSSISLARPS